MIHVSWTIHSRSILCRKQGAGTVENGSVSEAKQDTDEPRKIGYKTFSDGHAAYKYYKMLLRELTHNQDLNEVSHCRARL